MRVANENGNPDFFLSVCRHVYGYLELRDLATLSMTSRLFYDDMVTEGIHYPCLSVYEHLEYHVMSTVSPYLVAMNAVSSGLPSLKGNLSSDASVLLARTPYSTHCGGFCSETNAQNLRLRLPGSQSRWVSQSWLYPSPSIQKLWLSRLKNVQHIRLDIDPTRRRGLDPEVFAFLLYHHRSTLLSLYIFWRPPSSYERRGVTSSHYWQECWSKLFPAQQENENLFSADDTLQQVKNAAIYRARMPALTPSSASRSLVDSDQTGVLSWSPQRVVLSSEETALRKLFSPYKTGGILQRSIDSGHCLNAFPLRAKRLTVRQPEQHRKIRFGRRTVHPRRKQQRPRLLRRVVLLQLKAEKLSKKPRYLDQEKEAAAVSDSLLDTTQQNSGEQENVDAIPPHDHTCNASLDDAKHTENNLVCLPIIDFPLLRIFSVQTGDQYSAEFFRHLRIPKCNQLLIEEWDPVYDPPDGLLCGIPLRAQRHLCRQQLLQGLYNAAGSLNTDCFIASWWFKPATTIPLFEGEHIPNWIPLVESPENLKDAHLLIGCTSSCSRGRLRILSAGLTALYYNVFRFHQETIERISCRAPELASQALIVCGSSATSSFVERLCEIDAGTAGLLLHDFAVNVLVRYPHINWKSAHVIVGSNGVDTHITAHEAFRPGDAHVAALLERLLLKRLQLQVHILTLGAISEALVNTFSEETEVLRSSLAAQSASETRSSDCSELRTDQVDQKNGKADDYSSVVLGTSALVVGAPNAGYRARFTPRSSAMTESWSREPKDGWWPARGQHYDLGLAASAADNLPEHASVLQQETEREAYSKDPSAFLLTRLPRVMNFCNCIQLDLLSYTPRFSAVVSTVESSKAFYARTETLLKRMILGTSGKHQHPLTRSKTRLRVRAGRHCPAELLQFLPKYHLDIVRDTQLLADILKQSRARAQLRGVAGPVVLIKEALNLMYRNLYQWNRPRLKTVEVWIPYLMFRPLASIAHVMKFVAAHKYVRELRVHPLKIPRFLTVYDVFGPKSPEADLLKQLVVNQYFHRDRVAEVEVWGLHQQPMFVFTRPISFRYKIKKWRLRNGYGVKHLPPEVEE